MNFNILVVTSGYSPFWVELADEINKNNNIKMHIIFTGKSEGRGKHWDQIGDNKYIYLINPQQELEEYLNSIIKKLKPNIVICGGLKEKSSKYLLKKIKSVKIKVGIFAEQPNKEVNIKNRYFYKLNLIYYRILFYVYKPDFILAAGDRAVEIYKKLTNSKCQVIFYPYYQKLNKIINYEKIKYPVKFLFSGRLVARNSIGEMLSAFKRLSKSHKNQFNLCISAEGPQESLVNDEINSDIEFQKHIFYDRDFTTWDDRLRPFRNADILVLPSKHSGWGLVIPEALSLGLPVISTKYVESARYFLRHSENGYLIEPTTDEIYKALVFSLENIDKLNEIKINTFVSAIKGDVSIGSARLLEIFNLIDNKKII